MRQLTKRMPKEDNELVILKREGELCRWHGRTEDGELIIVDQYRHDAQEFLETRGFSWEMDLVGES